MGSPHKRLLSGQDYEANARLAKRVVVESCCGFLMFLCRKPTKRMNKSSYLWAGRKTLVHLKAKIFFAKYPRVAQLEEHMTFNHRAAGSSPATGTK